MLTCILKLIMKPRALWCSCLVWGMMAPVTQAETITVLGTNDLHGHVENMARLDTLVKQERLKDPDALLLSAGDNRGGNKTDDRYPRPGWPILVLMNHVGFDCSALGNHSFERGPGSMKALAARAAFPLVCANVTADSGGITIEPYHIFERKGVKVGVLGLLQLGKNGVPDATEGKTDGFSFRDPYQAAREYKWLKEKCDILIVLSHLGMEGDLRLARECPWVDAIVGGHSHSLVDGAVWEGNVMVTQAGVFARNVTRIVFEVREGTVLSKTAETLTAADYEADAETQAIADKFWFRVRVMVITAKILLVAVPLTAAGGVAYWLFRRRRSRVLRGKA